MQLEAYQLVECIYEGRTTRVFRGVRRVDAMKVIIKVHRSALPRPSDITSFHNHFNITRLISSERIVRPLAIEQHGNVLALISEDRGETSLREELRNNPPTPARVMAIGIMLAQALEDLYAAQVIHKDVKPDNILVDPQSGVVRLGDFAISTLLPREAREAQRDTALSGTLAYISPEQTGRLHRWIDHRSDLYSLGVTLYELATGTLPFTASEPMEIIHAHLTRRPIRPSTVNRAVPPALCEIIMKLLAKAPGDRYQSPTGLRLDLEECLRQCREHGSAASFPLGVHDSIERFGVPDELYGRASEVQQLLSTFDGVVKGESALMFVMGSSGIGKSALVRAIQEPILRHQGYFAAGKFDQYNRDIPFSSLVQAFRDLLRQILTEEHHRLTTYKSRLTAALGTDAGVVADVIPEVELFIGSSSPIVELPPADNRERFIRTFKRFIHAFADPRHPLVVFLDDLQWADTATLELLVAIFEHEPPSAFLFMGAYRDNEVDLAHPLARAIDRLENRGFKMERIHLEPLGLDDVACLVAGALRCSPEDVRDMAQSILERTGGNPFYCTRYLQSLYDDGHLQFNRQARRFERKLGALRDVEGRTDVVNFMLGRLERFAPETRDALKFAAAIGSRFSLETLAMLRDLPHSRVAEALWPALVEGLILPLDDAYRAFQGGSKSLATTNASMMGGAYRFLHDRVQQAAYLMIDVQDRPAVHLSIGRHLLSSTSSEKLDDILFEIMGHLEKGRGLATNRQERVEFATHYLRAGEKARASTAYAAAMHYFASGLDLLGDESFSEQYHLAMTLCKKCAEATYLEGYFDRSEVLVRRAISAATSALDKADAYMILIVQYTLRAKYPEAIEAGREALALVGIDLPRGNFAAARDQEIAEIESRMKGRSVESLIELPVMNAPDKLVAMRLLTTMGPPCYRSHQALWAVITSKAVNLTLQYGNAPQAAYSHTSYGGLLGWVKNDYAQGALFGELAVRLADSLGTAADRAVAALMIGSSLRHWSAPLAKSSRDYNDAYNIGLESGNLQYAAYAFGHNMYCRFWQGAQLDQLLSEIAGYLAFSESRKNRWAVDLLEGGKLVASTLAGRSHDNTLFCLPNLDETTYLARCRQNANTQVSCIYAILKSEALYILDELDLAFESSLEAEARISEVGTQGLLPWARHIFISSLIAARLARRSADADRRQKLREQVERGKKQVEIWANRNPSVFLHQHKLLSAELACIDDRLLEAIEFGDLALSAARESMCTQDVAIVAECVAIYWKFRNRPTISHHYLREAGDAFRRWGAIAKENLLRRLHPQVFTTDTDERLQLLRVDQTITHVGGLEQALDLGTVLSATQAIFGEMALERLCEKFLHIAMENAGASRGFLLLPRDKEFVIADFATTDDKGENRTEMKVAGGKYLSEGVVHRVARTGLPMVIDDGDLGLLATDVYLELQRPPSLACLPMMNRNRLVAILYLENHFVSDCFTPNRMAMLRVLGAQAAIALDNATLYADLQRAETQARLAREELANQVESRTRDLQHANDELMRRAEELSFAREQLEAELAHREAAENARAALQQEVIDNQNARMAEMSTPIIPISDQIMIMPLIGMMDQARAEQVKTTALEGVSARGVRTMILDLTGMRQVDSSVAQTVMETASALRLLGCSMILTGVRADMARAITELGLDFSGFVTCSTLQSGISRALGKLETKLWR